MSDTSAELSRIASTLELADGLALILVVGPDFRAPEGLSLLHSSLPAPRPTLWHRLDRDGPDVVSAVERAQLDAPIVLVHGLENLEQHDRATTESSLNMLRDRLALIRAAIILWVPRSDLETFQRHCADLFAWRSLLVSLSEEQVPIEPTLEAQRIYLFRLRTVLGKRITRLQEPLPQVRPELLSNRWVVLEETQGAIGLEHWVRATQYGILSGEPKSGKTTALMALALLFAMEAADKLPGTPCPLFVTARDLYLGPAFGLDLNDEEMPTNPFPGSRLAPVPQFGAWAQSGDFVLMLDGLDEVEGSAHNLCIDWLERLQSRYPRMRLIVAGRTDAPEIGSSWIRARLKPLSFAELHAQMGGLPTQSYQNPMLQSVHESLEGLKDYKENTLPANLLIHVIARTANRWIAAALLESSNLRASTASKLGPILGDNINWWFSQVGPKLHSILKLTPQASRWLLAFLAFDRLERGTAEIIEEDILHALESLRTHVGPYPALPVSSAQAVLSLHQVSRYLPWLIIVTGPQQFRFTHPVFQAFFAADWVVESMSTHLATKYLAINLKQPQWRAVAIMAASQFASRRSAEEAREFIAELLRIPATSGAKQLSLWALVIECVVATRFSAQVSPEWRAKAEQLCHTTTHSEEEEAARKELCDALERMQESQRST